MTTNQKDAVELANFVLSYHLNMPANERRRIAEQIVLAISKVFYFLHNTPEEKK